MGDQALTLTHHILSVQQDFPEATGDLSILLHSIEIDSKFVSSKVRAAGIFDLYGLQGSTNVQGEEVKKLDVIANTAFIQSLSRSHKVCAMASEENEDPIILSTSSGKYVAVFDPLDGSSNIDVNISIGTIFGIYKRLENNEPPSVKDIIQPGTSLVVAGYVMYGSATLLVLTTGKDVNCFTLDPANGEFLLTHKNIKMKPKHSIYSINEGNSMYAYEAVRKYVDSVKYPEGNAKPYSLRYVGSMVADVHRTLIYGGVFMYPADKSSKSGKLRLLYEANPMAMIMEVAGGMGSTGTARILDIVPTSVHQRTGVILGSKENVLEVEAFYKQYPPN